MISDLYNKCLMESELKIVYKLDYVPLKNLLEKLNLERICLLFEYFLRRNKFVDVFVNIINKRVDRDYIGLLKFQLISGDVYSEYFFTDKRFGVSIQLFISPIVLIDSDQILTKLLKETHTDRYNNIFKTHTGLYGKISYSLNNYSQLESSYFKMFNTILEKIEKIENEEKILEKFIQLRKLIEIMDIENIIEHCQELLSMNSDLFWKEIDRRQLKGMISVRTNLKYRLSEFFDTVSNRNARELGNVYYELNKSIKFMNYNYSNMQDLKNNRVNFTLFCQLANLHTLITLIDALKVNYVQQHNARVHKVTQKMNEKLNVLPPMSRIELSMISSELSVLELNRCIRKMEGGQM